MTLPPVVPVVEPGRVAGGGAGPAAAIWRSIVRWSIVFAFVLRAYLSLLQAQAVASGGVVSIPFSTGALGSDSIVWPLTWGLLALATAVALAVRVGIGWLLGTAVTVAYVVTGIADSSTMGATFHVDAGRAIESVAVGLVVPLVMLAGLFAIRGWYIPAGRLPIPKRARLQGASQGTLERWRRRD